MTGSNDVAARPTPATDCGVRPQGGALKVPFGLSLADGRMYGPLEVARGKACNCVCPGCQQPLLAKQPSTSGRVPHFAHAQGADCATGLETSVHLAAKQIIEQERALYVPALHPLLDIQDALGKSYRKEVLIAPAGRRALDKVWLEKAVSTVRPDVLATPVGASDRMAIEIAVTHFVDETKRKQFKQLRLPALEFDLSACRDLSWEALREALLMGSAPVRWVYHPQIADQLKAWTAELAPALHEARQQAAEMEALEREQWARKREAALRQDAAARARRLAEAQMLKQQRHQELVKATRFKRAAEAVKYARLASSFGREVVPDVLRATVAGGNSFGVQDPVLWQGVLFRKLVHGAVQAGHPVASKDYAVAYLGYRFEITPQFADAEKIAVWQYLSYLEEKGAFRKAYRQNFEVRAASLAAFELLQAFRQGQVSPERGLCWAPEEAWPTGVVAYGIKEAHAGYLLQEGALLRIAAIKPSQVRELPLQAVLDRFVGQGATEQVAKAQSQAMLEYWICAGFVVAT